MAHIPVLLKEAIYFLDPKPGEYFIDATIGSGGHAKEIIKRIVPGGKLLGIDWNKDAIMKIRKVFKKEINSKVLILEEGNFANISEIVKKKKFPAPHGILADLGMSIEEIEESGRGFSFKKEEPLIMTYQKIPSQNQLTAEKIVNEFSKESLEEIFKKFGEEKYADKIAQAIVSYREKKKIESAKELAQIIENSYPNRKTKIHPATRVFQALRIVVNDELENLNKLIDSGFSILTKKGRMVIISYHSLEDRIVKYKFRRLSIMGFAKTLTKKPICPTYEEVKKNRRSRSAKLRAIQKI
jgi:16S rRNA (cytosine1402-N4)-methyltransferase